MFRKHNGRTGRVPTHIHRSSQILIDLLQTRVSGMSTNTMLRDLQPDTEYKVTVVPVYSDVEGKRVSENGKTSECGKKTGF